MVRVKWENEIGLRRAYSKGSEGKVLKMDRPAAGGFLSLTGLSGRGLWWRLRRKFYKKGARLRRGLCRRVVFASAQGATAATALKVADCPSGNTYKVSVTGLAFSVIYFDTHYGDQPPSVAFPPLVPYGTTFPPLSGGTIKHREAISPYVTLS